MKQLKSLLIAALLFIGVNQTISAQAKVAHIDVNELMSAMPEMKTANAQLEKISQNHEKEYGIMVEEFQNKIKKYGQEAETVSEAINQTRETEVQDMRERIRQYQQTASQDIQKRKEDLMKPIMEKSIQAIHKVAKAKGYQYVLDSTMGGGVLLADGPSLLADVKKELGF